MGQRQSKVSWGTTLASPIGRGVGSPNFARLRNARASPNAPAPRGNAQFARFRGLRSQSPSARGEAELERRFLRESKPQTPPRRARWGNDFHWALGGLFSHNAPTGEARRWRLFFLCRFERRETAPSRSLSISLSLSLSLFSLSLLSRFSTHDPTLRREQDNHRTTTKDARRPTKRRAFRGVSR